MSLQRRRGLLCLGLLCLTLLRVSPVGAGFDEGLLAYTRGDYATALREFRLLADQGHAAAQLILGVMYDTG
ncbi:MAG: hypothetical protein FJZ47_12740 [Candidatus Tectomicrobia bacterium]|uniref:Sel1 repeat family protein n=1 Tax=Tectimicrobiota bacterium TaxID=2528274 RepID=A0A938B4G7_UNCTE|nr:hypothetical protein [Candidatus Tectomicrobia bacterium]